jgi:hypothetical protein
MSNLPIKEIGSIGLGLAAILVGSSCIFTSNKFKKV